MTAERLAAFLSEKDPLLAYTLRYINEKSSSRGHLTTPLGDRPEGFFAEALSNSAGMRR